MSDNRPASAGASAKATLTIDLAAIRQNYHHFARRAAGAVCAAAVKADAYGLGIDRVAPALAAGGCTTFFVAHTAEGIALRRMVPDATIYVLHGLANGPTTPFLEHDLQPVLNSLAEIEQWSSLPQASRCPAAIHVDTGMNRLGLSHDEAETLLAKTLARPGIVRFPIALLMSHLACADDRDHPMNAQQLASFKTLGERFRQAFKQPDLPLSLANSAATLLDPAYHFDLVRPGIGLYGGNPFSGPSNPMAPVIKLQGAILQVRTVTPPDTVGYGAAYGSNRPCRIATLDVGYADGFLRALGQGRLQADLDGIRVPIVGRISMDLMAVDVTDAPATAAKPGKLITLLGDAVTLDQASEVSGLSAYELLTQLGPRYNRVYVG